MPDVTSGKQKNTPLGLGGIRTSEDEGSYILSSLFCQTIFPLFFLAPQYIYIFLTLNTRS